MNIKYTALIVALLISVLYIPVNYLIIRDVPMNRYNIEKVGYPFAIKETVQDDTGFYLPEENNMAIVYNSLVIFFIAVPLAFLALNKYEDNKIK
jgi:hypothetical protein